MISTNAPNNQALTGTIIVTRSGSPPPDRVDFYLDGEASPRASDSTSPYQWTFNTTLVPDGDHTIRTVSTRRNKPTVAEQLPVKITNGAPPPVGQKPVNTSPPVITVVEGGTPQQGKTLQVGGGVWTNSPTGYRRQWLRCDAAGNTPVDIPGATATSYVLTATDVGSTIRIRVIAFNQYGDSDPVTSAATAVVESGTPSEPPPSGLGTSIPPRLPASTGTIVSVTSVSQLNTAIANALPGHRIQMATGTYAVDLRPTRSGTAAAPITLEALPGQTVVIQHASVRPLRMDTTIGYWIFRNLRFTGSPSFQGGNADIYGHHIEFEDCESDGCRGSCFYLDEVSHHVRFERCHMHLAGQPWGDRQTHGIYLQGNDHVIVGNLMEDFPNGFGMQFYDYGARAIIANNTCVRAQHDGIVVGGAGGVADAIVVNNICYDNNKRGIGHDSTCPTNSWADRNVLFLNDQGTFQTGCSGFADRGHRAADPLFVSYPTNLHLQATSPAKGYALPEYCYPYNFDGTLRDAADCGIYGLASTAVVYDVPTNIDKTGATDVTAALQSWINGVPNGTASTPTVLRFNGGTYRIDGMLTMTSRSYLTFDLNNNTTLDWNTPDNDSLRLLRFVTCAGIVIKNGTLLGTYTYPSSGDAYIDALQHMHAIMVDRTNIRVENVDISGFKGDGIYFGTEGSGTAVSSGYVTGCDIRRVGRSGISIVAADGVTIENGNHFQQCGLHGIDIEPNNNQTYVCRNITVHGNTWGGQVGTTQRPILIVLTSNTVPCTDIRITNNSIVGRSANITMNTLSQGTRIARVTMSGNTCDTAGPTEVWTLKEVDTLTVNGNTIPVSSGVVIGLYSCTAYSISGSTYTVH